MEKELPNEEDYYLEVSTEDFEAYQNFLGEELKVEELPLVSMLMFKDANVKVCTLSLLRMRAEYVRVAARDW